MNNLLFVDDHPLYREGFRRALAEVMPRVAIHVADSASAALEVLSHTPQVDLCLTDVRLDAAATAGTAPGGGDGLQLLATLAQRFPTVARAVLCADPTDQLAAQAANLGCVACLSKARDMHAIAQALEVVFNGGTVFDANPKGAGPRVVTAKRIEILQHAAAGLSNKEIAARLGIAERTVKDHWAHIFTQLGVANRAEAVGQAYRLALLSPQGAGER